MRKTSLLPVALIALFAMAPFAQASDNEDYEHSISETAANCPGHSKERTIPGVRGVPVGAIRVIQQHNYVLCPDRRLEGAAVVFYPVYGVFTWNPEDAASVKALSSVVDKLTRSEDFPSELTVWDAAGKPLKEQVVPSFEPKPNAPLHRALH